MSPSWAFKRPKSPKIIKMSFKMGNVRLKLAIANKVSGLSLRWHAIDKYQLRLYNQREEYCFWIPWGPLLKRQKSSKISKTGHKLSKVRLYLLITNKI
jgi:hypothetical protein